MTACSVYHLRRVEHAGGGFGFETPEVFLAMIGEDLGDGTAVFRGDEGVDVEKWPAQARREHTAHRGLARAHEAGKDDTARQRRGRRMPPHGPRRALAHFVGLEPEFGVLVRGERGLDVFPYGRAGVVDGQQQFGLLRDVLQVTDQGRALLAGLQMCLLFQVGSGFEELRKLILKFGAGLVD